MNMKHRPLLDEPTYKVVWPLGRTKCESPSVSSSLGDLSGKTVCEVWNRQFRGGEIFPVIRERLLEKYPGIKFVGHEAFGNTHGPDENQVLEALPGLLREQDCDLVISGIGA